MLQRGGINRERRNNKDMRHMTQQIQSFYLEEYVSQSGFDRKGI